MKVYGYLSRSVVAKRKYALKFFLAVLPLISIALAGPLIIISISKDHSGKPLVYACIIITALTILSAFLMLKIFNSLLAPLNLGKQALDDYILNGIIPDLPVQYEDEAGVLLKNIQSTIKQLNDLIVEKSDMIDLLSHDLRSPVSRILSLSSLIKEDPETDKEIYVDYINNECRSLLSMLENLLLTLKEDSQEFRLEKVNLKKLISDTLKFYNFAISEKDLKINVTIDDTICIHVQRQLFTQAVRNLLGNAIKFSPDGKSIFIEGKKNLDKVSFSIRDEGMGFKLLDIQKLFDRFTSAGKRGTHGETSTGLGLYLSKKIIEKHGGTLIAQSEGLNKGASFTITLYALITSKPQGKLNNRPEIKKIVVFHRR